MIIFVDREFLKDFSEADGAILLPIVTSGKLEATPQYKKFSKEFPKTFKDVTFSILEDKLNAGGCELFYENRIDIFIPVIKSSDKYIDMNTSFISALRTSLELIDPAYDVHTVLVPSAFGITWAGVYKFLENYTKESKQNIYIYKF